MPQVYFINRKNWEKEDRERDLSDRLIIDDRTFFWTPGISYVMLPNTLLVMVTIIEPLNCYVILPRTLSLTVKLLLGSQGMLPIPVPAKVVVVVSGKNCKETGNHSFHLLLTHFHETRDTEEKIDELACFLFCFPNKQKICELPYLLDPMISPFRTHGGPVGTPI